MAVTFRAYSDRTFGNDTVSCGKPTGTINGDIMLAWIVAYSDPATTISAPSGWTEIGTTVHSGGKYRCSLFWKRAAASEGSSYAFTFGGYCTGTASILSYIGCVTSGSPVDVYSNTAYETSNKDIVAASVTTTVANALLVFIGYAYCANYMWDGVPPAGMTERLSVGTQWERYAADVSQASTGASGSKTASFSAGDNITVKHAFLVALSPAPAQSISPSALTAAGDVGTPAVAVWDDTNSIRLLPEATVEVSTLESANKVYVVVEGSSAVGSATNTTDDPTYADSPREAVVFIKSGDATFCDTVAAAQLAVMKVERYRLNGLPVRLRDGLGIERGQTVLVTIPRAGVSAVLPVRRLEHDFAANVTLIDVGEFSAPRSDSAALAEVAKRLDQLTKESKI